MDIAQVPAHERKLWRMIVWTSTLAVAGCLALLFGFDNQGGEFRYHFTLGSVVAFVGSLFLMGLFWKRVFALIDRPRRLWRFIIVSCVLLIVLFIGMIFLPRFKSVGSYSGDLLQGVVFGFLAVAVVFYLAWKTMQLFERADDKNNRESR